jgi:Domain of unknown function (DUF4157)
VSEHLRIQRKATQNSATAQKSLQPRPFAPLQPESGDMDQPRLQTQLEHSQKLGHQLANLQQMKSESIQREVMPEEEELQMKPASLQRLMPEEEELQRSATPEAIGGGEASADLESSIQAARGSGQAIDDSIRKPIENAFGADFSGVKIHTDAQSNQLNRSLHSRAFTTGQDVFFKQGEYNHRARVDRNCWHMS